MSKKLFAILLAVTVVVGLLLLLQSQKGQDEKAFGQTVLLPQLATAVNDLDWLQIVAAGDQTVATLERTEGGWVVDEASGYTADWERLRGALAALAQAETLEPKTSNPDYYDRLGVEDVSADDAQGVLIRFSEDSGLPGVIIGNAAQGRSGQYARLLGSQESFLLDREIDISTAREEWLERAIVNVAEDEVVEVTITHADGESIQISKVSAEDADFTLQGIPDGKQIKSNWTVNSLAGGLNALELDDVVARPETIPETAVSYRLLTAGGLVVDALWFEQSQGDDVSSWLTLSASAFDEGDNATSEEDTLARIEEINSRVQGWAYRVSDYKFDNVTKRMDDLLDDIEQAEEGGEES